MFFKKNKPVVRKRDDHCISRSDMDSDAVKVLYRLSKNNYIAYLVGGSVRDLLLKKTPKDFDISTDAQPGQIRKIFRNCFLIGRRFRLAHIVFGRKVIETSTFRATPKAVEGDNCLYQSEDNTFGTPAEDALRRDFTINGLFYDIKSFSVIDYVGGLKDLDKKVIRSIGNPNLRFQEDPVRMMRAIKFASKLDFTLEKSCNKALKEHHADILNASVPRVCEEVFRMFTVNASERAFRMMWEFRLLNDLLAHVSDYIDRSGRNNSPIWRYLAALDAMPDNADFSNGIRTAVLHYPLFLEACEKERSGSAKGGKVNRMHVARRVLRPLTTSLNIPKAVFHTAVSVMEMVPRFENMPAPARAERFSRNNNFLEAYAFMRILVQAGDVKPKVLEQWSELHKTSLKFAADQSKDLSKAAQRRKRHPRGRGRRKRRS